MQASGDSVSNFYSEYIIKNYSRIFELNFKSQIPNYILYVYIGCNALKILFNFLSFSCLNKFKLNNCKSLHDASNFF